MNDENMNYERAKVFFEKQIVVHVSKKDGRYFNGLILEVTTNHLFINDRKEGRQLVLFSELLMPIEEFREKVEVEDE